MHAEVWIQNIRILGTGDLEHNLRMFCCKFQTSNYSGVLRPLTGQAEYEIMLFLACIHWWEAACKILAQSDKYFFGTEVQLWKSYTNDCSDGFTKGR